MTDLDIIEALEKKNAQEEKQQIEAAVKEDVPKKNNDARNVLIMVAVLLGVFVLFTGGFSAYNKFTGAAVIDTDYLHQMNYQGKLDSTRGYMYNGYSFVFNQGLWYTEVKETGLITKIPLHFGPKNLTQIPVTGTLDPNFNKGDIVYVAIDPEFANKYYTLALSELNFNIVKGIRRKPSGVCTKKNDICEERDILSCDNNQGKPVIELKWANETKITSQGTCILVQGKDYGIVKAVDRLVLQWYGIMK